MKKNKYEVKLPYKGKLSLELAHVGKLSKFKLIRQVNNITHDFKKTMQVVKEMDEINKTIKAFYNLFEDSTREYLIKLDKEVNKYYNEFCDKVPYRLVNRNILRNEYHGQPGKRDMFSRVGDKFEPYIKLEQNATVWSEEKTELEKYTEEMDCLARLLYIQEKTIECAIEVALKDNKSKKTAIELAAYLGYINGDQYKDFQEKQMTKRSK